MRKTLATCVATALLAGGTACGTQTLHSTDHIVSYGGPRSTTLSFHRWPGNDRWGRQTPMAVLGTMLGSNRYDHKWMTWLTQAGVAPFEANAIVADWRNHDPYPALRLLETTNGTGWVVRQAREVTAATVAYLAFRSRDRQALTEAARVFADYTYSDPYYQRRTHALVVDAERSRGWSPWDLYQLDGMSMMWVSESLAPMGIPNPYQAPPTRPPH